LSSRNPKARANLAIVEGILRTYQDRKLDSLEIRSSAEPKAIELFNKFVNYQPYKQLSEASRALGNPATLGSASRRFSELSRDIANSKVAGGTLEVPKTRIAASSGPLKDSPTDGIQLNPEGFLPPIVSFANVRIRAAEVYKAIKPEPLIH